jgi:hypothetical protein
LLLKYACRQHQSILPLLLTSQCQVLKCVTSL